MVKLSETVERSSMCSYDLENRDSFGYEIENGPSCRYDPTDNPQDATITLNTNHNATNFHSLLFFCCQTSEQNFVVTLDPWLIRNIRTFSQIVNNVNCIESNVRKLSILVTLEDV